MDETADARYDGGNRIIDGLSAADRAEVTRHVTMMTAEEASGGISRGERIEAAYFPIDAVFSVLVELSGGECYEADSVGREGFIGSELLLGADLASRSVICQVGGRFAQISADAFERCVAHVPPFAAAVRRALLMQWYRAQQTIACNFAHTLVQRCARWTLLTHDAIGRPEFPLRAEYLAMMLGVQTHVVVEPMAVLVSIGAIRRGDETVTVTSERRLREAACDCYTAPVEHAKRLESRKPLQRESP
jgi:CRP-like cAMP-binding protein